MTRRWLAILLAALVALGGLVAVADEPPPDPSDAPLRLKKKKADDNKPAPLKEAEKKPEEKKPNEKKEEVKEEPAPTEPQQDEKEVMERLARNVRSIDERLTKGELNGETRQLKED